MTRAALDRVSAAALTWLLILTWATGVLVVVLFAGGADENSGSVAWWVVVVAVVAVVATCVPLLRWLRPAVDAVLYSHPDDATVLIAQVARDAQGSVPITAQTADQIARRLRLPYVAIAARDEPIDLPDDARLVRMPLTFAGERVGTLAVLPRARDRALAQEDLALLRDLAGQLGITLHALGVGADLQASRAALVGAREEERRRIRRDLHDGLGPTLASLRLHLAAVDQLIDTDPARARKMVGDLRTEGRESSAAVRTLVYGLGPAALSELGLAAALRARADEVTGVEVVLDLPDPVPPLPAAVEVALYRIAAEALANVGRHAAATTCRVSLVVGPDVRLEVDDDGRGLPAALVPGVGLTGIRERAEELGGTVATTSDGGTTLVAVLPSRVGG